MKSQKHNQGDLAEMTIKIEKEIYEVFLRMTENTGIPLDDLVVVAMKRFRAHHADYEGVMPRDES